MSRPTQSKLAKKRKRFKAGKKQRNVARNMAPVLWRLDVLLDGTWCTAMKFRRKQQLEDHVKDTEKRRDAGETIAQGRVVSMATGKTVLEIEGSERAKGPKDAKAEGKPEAKKKKNSIKDRIPEGAAQ